MASKKILSTFVFLFESNTKKAKLNIDKFKKSADATAKTLKNKLRSANTSVGDSFRRLSGKIKTTKDKMNQLNTSTQKFKRLMGAGLGVGATLLALGGLTSIISSTANELDALGKAGRSLDINSEKLFIMGQNVERAGGSTEGFIGSLKNLSRILVEVRRGSKEYSEVFEKLGIDLKSPIPIINQIVSGLEKIDDKATQVGLLKKLRIDTGTIQFLQQGTDLIEKQNQFLIKNGLIFKDQIDSAEKYNDFLSDIDQSWTSITARLIDDVNPAAELFSNILKEIATKDFKDMSNSSKIAIAIMSGGLVAIGVTLAALVVSIVGIPALIVAGIASSLVALVSAIALYKDEIGKFFVDDLGGFIDGLKSKIKSFDQKIVSAFNKVTSFSGRGGRGQQDSPFKNEERVTPFIRSDPNLAKNSLRFSSPAESANRVRDILQQTEQRASALSSGSVLTSSNENNILIENIQINTQSTDAQGIADDIRGVLSEELSKTLNDFDTGTR
jgi:hypothetical protein